jgi:hypothetical protein
VQGLVSVAQWDVLVGRHSSEAIQRKCVWKQGAACLISLTCRFSDRPIYIIIGYTNEPKSSLHAEVIEKLTVAQPHMSQMNLSTAYY